MCSDDNIMESFRWMSYSDAHKYEKEASYKEVSVTARSSKGFMREYELAGTVQKMRDRPLPKGVVGGKTWNEKRHNFIQRHLAQYKKNPTHRRYLALIMWAYRPRMLHRPSKRGSGPRTSKRSSREQRNRRHR